MKIARALSPRFVFLTSLLLSLTLGVVDWASGYELQFFIFYFIPITLAGWNCGLARTMTVSGLCGGLWFYIDLYSGHPYSNWYYSCWSALIRTSSFLLNGYSVVRIKALLVGKRKAMAELEQALVEVKTLKGLLPVCAGCKRVRNDEGYWRQINQYLGHRSDALLFVGRCDECAAKATREIDIHASSTASPVRLHGAPRRLGCDIGSADEGTGMRS